VVETWGSGPFSCVWLRDVLVHFVFLGQPLVSLIRVLFEGVLSGFIQGCFSCSRFLQLLFYLNFPYPILFAPYSIAPTCAMRFFRCGVTVSGVGGALFVPAIVLLFLRPWLPDFFFTTH